MRIKDNFVLRQVAGSWVVLPIAGQMLNLGEMLTLNDSGVLLWNTLAEGADREKMADVLMETYEIDRATVLADVDAFIDKLALAGCLEMQ